ncbi:tetratricopeptide repeat protein [Priestia megaterium]|nr:tetratricopeptide repeat protein [Priestia megaterium]
MNIDNIPFNMNYRFNKQLREVPVNEAEMKKGIAYLKEKAISKEDEMKAAKMYGYIGVYERILFQLSSSERHLQLAIYLCERHDDYINAFVNTIRLAHTYHWQENWTKANDVFKHLIKQLQNDSSLHTYEDFVYQHYGKCLLDQKNVSKAHHYFQHALEIRLKKGNKELIESTNSCIRLCLNKVKLSSAGESSFSNGVR